MPKGVRMAQMPINGTTPSYGPAPVKHAFVCVGANTKKLAATIATHTHDPAAANAYAGICSDGLNAAGLSGEKGRKLGPLAAAAVLCCAVLRCVCGPLHSTMLPGYTTPISPHASHRSHSLHPKLAAAWLWDSNNALGNTLPSSAAGAAGETITYFDVTARVLGQCDTIACARDAVSKLAAVNTPFAKAITSGVIGGGYDFTAVHGTFCDKSGRCIGVEWPKPGPAAIYDLPQGVFTNEPGVPVQVALYGRYLAASQKAYGSQGPAAPLLNWPGGVLEVRPLNLSLGASEPAARYTRMAMMMQLYGPVPYGTPKSPASPGHYGNKLAALSQISTLIVSAGVGASEHWSACWVPHGPWLPGCKAF